jgi:hypothetical protein
VQNQIKDAVQHPGTMEQGKLEMLMAKAEHARLTGPDVLKLRNLLSRIQVTKGLLEQAIVEKKESQLIQALQEGRDLCLNPVLLQEGERALQRINERKTKRLLAKNEMSTPAMQAISISSATLNADNSSQPAAAAKMSLIQEVFAPSCFVSILLTQPLYQEAVAALRFSLSMASLSVQEKRTAQAVAQHVQARDLEGAVAEQVMRHVISDCILCFRMAGFDVCVYRLLCERHFFSARGPSLRCRIFRHFEQTTAANPCWLGAPNLSSRRS